MVPRNEAFTTSLGAVSLPQLPPERLRRLALTADEAGLDQLWLWEDCFLTSGVATASAVLAWTERLRVGVGLLPVPLRNVALTAMELASLHRLFPGRLDVGVGHGVQDWMAQVGARVESPMTLLREYLHALRALLAGQTVTVDGRYVHLDDVALAWAPGPVSIFAGAAGPRSVRLTGECADGTILTGGNSPDRVRELIGLVEQGRVAANRAGEHRIVVYVHAATGPTAHQRIEAEGRRWGYDSVREVAAVGDAHAVAEAVARWAEAGADAVVLQPTPDDPDPEGFVRFVATEVRPLVP